MARIGNIEIFNVNENYSNSVNITEYEVEKGSPFSDHVKQSNPSFGVNGYIFEDNWMIVQSRLEDAMKDGKIMKYVGKFSVTDVVIESVKLDGDKYTANGVELQLRLRKIRITKNSWLKAPKKQIPQRKPVTNSGEKKPAGPREDATQTFHTVKAGDTYWYMSRKYGVPVDWLIANNKYEPRKIPIGVKIRIS